MKTVKKLTQSVIGTIYISIIRHIFYHISKWFSIGNKNISDFFGNKFALIMETHQLFFLIQRFDCTYRLLNSILSKVVIPLEICARVLINNSSPGVCRASTSLTQSSTASGADCAERSRSGWGSLRQCILPPSQRPPFSVLQLTSLPNASYSSIRERPAAMAWSILVYILL